MILGTTNVKDLDYALYIYNLIKGQLSKKYICFFSRCIFLCQKLGKGVEFMAEVKKETKKKASSKAKEKKPANRKSSGNNPERDSKGRFVKGVSGNPNGRPKLPPDIFEYAREAPARLRLIADDPDTPVKVKAEIERWFAEMAYGKSRQQVDIEADVENKGTVTVEFEGDLSEWSV